MTAASKWSLWRQDDNGNAVVIERHLEKNVAEDRMKELEARGHKQHYWIEEEPEDRTPQMNLVVIRAEDLEETTAFYEKLGLKFQRHQHGKGLMHYACETPSFVFEIYPQGDEPSIGTRLGFSVSDVDTTVKGMRETGYEIISEPKDSPWGRRAVVRDPAGHRVELTSP